MVLLSLEDVQSRKGFDALPKMVQSYKKHNGRSSCVVLEFVPLRGDEHFEPCLQNRI